MNLKKALPVLFVLLILMPMVGVGVVWVTTSQAKDERLRAQAERFRMEADRRAELAEEARRRSEAAARQLPNPAPKQ